jgi:LPXTG-site transpeptidase (sortase) family protein
MSRHQPHNLSFFSILWAHKWAFAIILIVVVWLTISVLYLLGVFPEELVPAPIAQNIPTLGVIEEVPIFPGEYGPRYVFADQQEARTGRQPTQPSPTPTTPRGTSGSTASQRPSSAVVVSTDRKPTRIVIEKIGVDTKVLNPDSQKVSVLDEALKSGVVRYPGSGIPGDGNMFVFGHSTSFRVVQNQAYKAFNNLEKLAPGDIVKVYTGDREYRYRVTNVKSVSEEKALVDLSGRRDMLTLSTCNTFGRKQDRFVVEADFVSSQVI